MSAVLRFNVAGATFRKDDLDRVYRLYNEVKAHGHSVEILLESEPTNKFDKNAVKVMAVDTDENIFFGYVPRIEQGALEAFQKNHPKHTIRIAYMGDNHTGTGNIGCIVELKETN